MITREQILKQSEIYALKLNNELEESNYYVDMDMVKKVISFISLLKHTGGSLAGVPFQLLPFQIEFLINVLCVKNQLTRKRRYTTAFLMIPRKNGKTELIGAVLNYFLYADKEKGKEIYCAANETDQAKIIFNATETMIKQNKTLNSKVTIFKSTRTIEKEGEFKDFIKVLTSNADTKDGLKPYVFVYDELHAAKDGSLYTVLEEGMLNREEPLAIIISTAGYNHQGIMKQKYDYAKQVKQGIIKDDSFYSMIFEPSEKDLGEDGEGWKNEKVWEKVNPALGYGVKIDNLRNKFVKALHNGEDEVAFKTKHLNIWTNSASVWIKDELWIKNPNRKFDIQNRECYVGLDLSSTIDISSAMFIFPCENGSFDIFRKYYIPEDNMRARARNDQVPYVEWVNKGYITATPGNVIDYDYIQRDILDIATTCKIKLLNYDRFNATQIITNLSNEGVEVNGFGQGFVSMNAPTQMLHTLTLQQKINHQNCPVLRWMLSNVIIQQDAAGNIKCDKGKSRDKIDGIIALIMAIGAWMGERKQEATNPYSDRDMVFL